MPRGVPSDSKKLAAAVQAANRYAPSVVTFALVLATAFELALITRQLLPRAPVAVPAQPAAAAGAPTGEAKSRAGYESLLSAHLFGEAPPEAQARPQEAPIDAPDTTLAVTLKGILFGEGGAQSTAIIETSRGREDAYEIGQTLEGSGAVLRAVYADRVVIEHDGRLETLRQPREAVAAAPAELPPARDEEPSEEPVEPEEEAALPEPSEPVDVDKAIERVSNVLQVTPSVQGDHLQGFVVNPGDDVQTFEALGFRPGDVITGIEDMSLEDLSASTGLLERFATATSVQVMILRDGMPQPLTVKTAPLRSGAPPQ